MQVTIIQIVIGAFGAVNKGLLKGLEDLEVGRRVEDNASQTTYVFTSKRGFVLLHPAKESCATNKEHKT